MKKDKLLTLLDVVIENYIEKWNPVWSKFLHTLDDVKYAPSTLRKYLNLLEENGLVYQPYNSSWRLPTLEWLTTYIDTIRDDEGTWLVPVDLDTDLARNSLRYLIEKIGELADGVVCWFLDNDEYYYLGINNLLKHVSDEQDTVEAIVDFIEKKEIIESIGSQMMKKNEAYYTFIEHESVVMSCVYGKVMSNGYQWVICIIGPLRVNYKKNLAILQKIVRQYG